MNCHAEPAETSLNRHVPVHERRLPLYRMPIANRQQAFDGLILYGGARHGEVCPGPLVRINKLRIPGRWQRLYLPPLGTHLPRW